MINVTSNTSRSHARQQGRGCSLALLREINRDERKRRGRPGSSCSRVRNALFYGDPVTPSIGAVLVGGDPARLVFSLFDPLATHFGRAVAIHRAARAGRVAVVAIMAVLFATMRCSLDAHRRSPGVLGTHHPVTRSTSRDEPLRAFIHGSVCSPYPARGALPEWPWSPPPDPAR